MATAHPRLDCQKRSAESLLPRQQRIRAGDIPLRHKDEDFASTLERHFYKEISQSTGSKALTDSPCTEQSTQRIEQSTYSRQSSAVEFMHTKCKKDINPKDGFTKDGVSGSCQGCLARAQLPTKKEEISFSSALFHAAHPTHWQDCWNLPRCASCASDAPRPSVASTSSLKSTAIAMRFRSGSRTAYNGPILCSDCNANWFQENPSNSAHFTSTFLLQWRQVENRHKGSLTPTAHVNSGGLVLPCLKWSAPNIPFLSHGPSSNWPGPPMDNAYRKRVRCETCDSSSLRVLWPWRFHPLQTIEANKFSMVISTS